MPPQFTERTATLAGHWVLDHNNGRLAVDVEGDKTGVVMLCTGAFLLYLRRSHRPLYGCSVVVPSLSPPPLVRKRLRVRMCAQ
jgi:hypothetical protein